MRIELPSGTYVPEFRAAEEVAPITPAEMAPAPAAPGARRFRPWMSAAAVVAVISMASIAGIWFTRARPTTLDQFWAPVLSGGSPVSLCVAWVPVYGIDKDPVPDQPPRPEELTLLRDQFVGGGDLVAASRLSSMLSGKKRQFYLRVGNAVSFNDLRAAPAILIGYSYTRWKRSVANCATSSMFPGGPLALPTTASRRAGPCRICRATARRTAITPLCPEYFTRTPTRCSWKSLGLPSTARKPQAIW